VIRPRAPARPSIPIADPRVRRRPVQVANVASDRYNGQVEKVVPELPDVTVYVEALDRRIRGARLERIRLLSPFVLRSVDPTPEGVAGRTVHALRRLGKRIAVELDGDVFVVVHLMIAGRLHWRPAGARPPGKVGLAAFDFSTGTMTMTEAGSKRRAAIYLVRGEAGLRALDPGGLEVLQTDLRTFRTAITRSNHTLKRALTDPHILSGIGNAYSDEILHRARLSPVKLTSQLSEEETLRLFTATRTTLTDWIERLRREYGDRFPEGVTAFRDGMAVHGRYGRPCPDCGAPVQRIVFAENETNYCAGCQTGGRLLADRVLSRLLRADWPRTLEELEERRRPHPVTMPPGRPDPQSPPNPTRPRDAGGS
jgi:formamidopyrimidine-DNA glycosylase